MVASYSGLIDFAGGATTVVEIDDLDSPSWRGTPRRLFVNHANPPAVWLVGVHLLDGPRAGQYANADLRQETPPFFTGRGPFGEPPPTGELGAQPRASSPEEAKLRAQLETLMADPAAPFREAAFKPFGLDDQWTGLRSIGGSGTSDGVIRSLTLTHGDPYDKSRALVRVTTVSPRHVHGDEAVARAIERSFLVRQLVGFIWRTTGVVDPEVRAAAFDPGLTPPDPTAPSEPVSISIDGDPTDGHLLEQDNAWVGLTERDGVLVAIEAQRCPRTGLGLRTVDPDALREYV